MKVAPVESHDRSTHNLTSQTIILTKNRRLLSDTNQSSNNSRLVMSFRKVTSCYSGQIPITSSWSVDRGQNRDESQADETILLQQHRITHITKRNTNIIVSNLETAGYVIVELLKLLWKVG